MKYSLLILLNFALFQNLIESCDEMLPVELKKIENLGNLNYNLQGVIAEYLPNGFAILRQINQNAFVNSKIYPVKYYVDRRFDIPELKEVDENEPELYGILSLSWCRNDPFLLFGALVEDLVSGKKPYKVLVPHLVKYLARTYKGFTENQQYKFNEHSFRTYLCSTEYLLGKICLQIKLYDLMFEILADKPEHLINFISKEVENWDDLMNFLKSNPRYAINYQRSFFSINQMGEMLLVENRKSFIEWMGVCLIQEAPERFYIQVLDFDPKMLTAMLSDFFIYQTIPESEYSRIYAKIMNLLHRYPHLYGAGYIFKIAFDPSYLDKGYNLITLRIAKKDLIETAKAAMFGNKSQLFRSCCFQMHDLIDKIFDSHDFERNYEGRKNFKLFFEVIASEGKESQFFKDIDRLKFMMHFYAIKHLKFEEKGIIFEFVAPQDLLDSGFPPTIYANVSKYMSHIDAMLSTIFGRIEVTAADEDTFSSFLEDYEKYPKFNPCSSIHYECFKIIAQSPRLIETLKNKNMTFICHCDQNEYEKVLDLSKIEGVSDVLNSISIYWRDLPKLRSKRLLKIAIEMRHGKNGNELLGKTVDELFFSYESQNLDSHRNLSELDYFQWRLVFDYWIHGDQKEQLKKIKSRDIIKLLRMEFHDEMTEIFGPEKKKA